MKNKNGITLIALIITIIVLLILAGVSISIIVGENGILNKAQESKEKTDEARIQEMKQLTASRAAMNLEGYTYTDKTGKKVYIPSSFAVSENPDEQLLEEGLVVIDKYGDEFVWVPATENNFKKKITSNERLGTGVVSNSLKDNYGNNPWLETAENATDSQLDEVMNKEKKYVVDSGGFFVSRYEVGADGNIQREFMRPDGNNDYVGNFDINYYVNREAPADDTKYWKDARDADTITGGTEKRQAIINFILPMLNSKKGIEPVRVITQDECLWLANSWKRGNDYQSGLITGTTWDRMLSFMFDDFAGDSITPPKFTKEEIKDDSSSWGNYNNTLSIKYNLIFTSGNDVEGKRKWISRSNGWSRNEKGGNVRYVFPTGEFISDKGVDTKKKNIYDVAGNVLEWTTEVSKATSVNNLYVTRVCRGGCSYLTGSEAPAEYRHGGNVKNNYVTDDVGFRVVIYVTD